MTVLTAVLFANPADDDFLEKIKITSPDLKTAFGRDSMSLSSATLTLFGYLPGPWLDWVPQNPHVYTKLQDEWITFDAAQEAIRGGTLKGFQNADGTFYVFLLDLFRWFMTRRVWIHPTVFSFVQSKCAPARKGRPEDSPEVADAIAKHFQKTKKTRITPADLREDEEPLRRLVQGYLSMCLKNQCPRRLKTLSRNVNKRLESM